MDAITRPTRITIPLMHGGLERPYLFQAAATAAGPGVPLVLEIHGRGIDPVRFDELTGFGELAAEVGFAVAMPSAVGEIWSDGRTPPVLGVGPHDDVAYLAAVVDDAVARGSIDLRRVYVVGMSNGATMAARLACELPGRFAAIAQVAGTAAVEVAAGCRPADTPVLNIHGSADDYAPYEGGTRHSLRSRIVLRHASRPSVPVDDWARFWVDANGAADLPEVVNLPPDTTIRTWRGPDSATRVVFYKVEGGGHTWPGSRWALPSLLFGRTTRTFNATRVIWEFLASHEL